MKLGEGQDEIEGAVSQALPMSNAVYVRGRSSIGQDLGKIFEKNKSTTSKISYLNRQTEKSMKRMSALL